jgi:hypothetical protein
VDVWAGACDWLDAEPDRTLYRASARRFDFASGRVERTGHIRWRRRKRFLSTALAHEYVALEPDDLHRFWTVSFGGVRQTPSISN